MNGHNTEGIAAYGPGDEMELMAAILAAHDEGDDPAWFQAIGDGDPLPIDPICPFCGWALIPVEDGRMICPDCGAAFNGPAELAQAGDLMALSGDNGQFGRFNRAQVEATRHYERLARQSTAPRDKLTGRPLFVAG